MVHLYLEVADQLKLDLRRVLWLVLAVLQNPYLYLNRIELAFNNGKVLNIFCNLVCGVNI